MNTLARLMMIACAAPMAAIAQQPPQPARPAPTPVPAPTVRPATPAKPLMPPMELVMPVEIHDLDLLRPRMDEMRLAMEAMRIDADRMKIDAMDLARIDVETAHAAREAMTLIDMPALEAKVAVAAEAAARVGVEPMDFRFDFEPMKFAYAGQERFESARPRAPWAQEDPADSLYRVAREALNRGEYRRAAQVFAEVTRKFPTSRYAQHSAYWEAFSRYRIGTTDELRVALRILEGKGEGVALQGTAFARNDNSVDIPGLRARVLGALASRGDRSAAEQLEREAAQNRGGCDREEVSVQAEALNALAQMDIATALPTVRKVLARRDECSVELRRRALYIVGRQPPPDAGAILLDVAKNDPDNGIRGEAMRWLPRVAGDQAVPQLQELLRTSTDESSQRSAINALGAIDSDVARRAVRTIIEREDVAERVRMEAILSLSREREGRTVSPEDMNYLRSLYTKMPSAKLKEAVLTSVSRVQSADSEQFLFGIARNVNEPASLRAVALQRLGRMEAVKAADIARLYDVADSRSMREQILSALSQRKEPEAIDKMIEIAKKDTDPRIRQYAVSLLGRAANTNERARQFLQSFFDQP